MVLDGKDSCDMSPRIQREGVTGRSHGAGSSACIWVPQEQCSAVRIGKVDWVQPSSSSSGGVAGRADGHVGSRDLGLQSQ